MSEEDLRIITEPVTSVACPKCGMVLDVTDVPAFTGVQCPSCEFEFQVPARFGTFMLLQLIGMGGMGGVYRARDEGLNREVAIKVIQKSLGDDAQFVESFQREAQAAAKLNHPNIAQIYSFGQFQGQPYIAMELVSGGSLDKMMKNGPVEPAVAFNIGMQIAEGLREAAEAGLVHGDVKPENILFDSDKNAKLVDFGIAAMQGSSSAEVWGTPYYIAPEKVQKQRADHRADIYSLGATLYHAIAGVPPFDGVDATEVVKARFSGPPRPLHDVRGSVPEEVESVIMRMLELDQSQRYPTYGSLLSDMRRYLAKAGPVKVATSSKKIMIKGKRPKSLTGTLGTLEDGSVEGLPEGMVPVEDIPVDDDQSVKRRLFKIVGAIVGGIVLLVLLVAGGACAILHSQEVNAEKARIARYEAGKTKALAAMEKAITEAKKLEERLRAYVPEAKGYADKAAEAVVAVLGDTVRSEMVPPEPVYEEPKVEAVTPPAAAATNSTVAATNGVAGAAATNGAAQAAAAAPTNASPAKVEAKQEAPKKQEEKKEEAQQPAEEAAPASDLMQKYPVLMTINGMYKDYYFVKAVSFHAKSRLDAILKTADKQKDLLTIEKEKELIALANEVVGSFNDMNGLREFSEVPRKISQMKKALESAKVDADSIAAQLKDEAKLKAEAEKKAEEEAKRRAEAEASAEKAKEEVNQVALAEAGIVNLLKKCEFRDALRTYRNVTVSTKEGLDAVATAEDRVKRIDAFHEFLVKRTPGFKSSRGWIIDAADAKFLTVGGKKIAWTEIYQTRIDIIGELVAMLVIDPQGTKGMGLRDRSRLMTNTAICLSIFYADMPPVVERAKQLAQKAAADFEIDAPTIKALLPAFFKE